MLQRKKSSPPKKKKCPPREVVPREAVPIGHLQRVHNVRSHRSDRGTDRSSPGGGRKRPQRPPFLVAIDDSGARAATRRKRDERKKSQALSRSLSPSQRGAIRSFFAPAHSPLGPSPASSSTPGTRPRSRACNPPARGQRQGPESRHLEAKGRAFRRWASLEKTQGEESGVCFCSPLPGAWWRLRRRRPSCRPWRGPRGWERGGLRP